MSNEKQAAPNSESPRGSSPPTQLTRIPLELVELHDGQMISLPGRANSSSFAFGKPRKPDGSVVVGRNYLLGWFVPSYQVVDVEFYPDIGSKREVERFAIPMSIVKNMKRSAEGKA